MNYFIVRLYSNFILVDLIVNYKLNKFIETN